MIGLVGDDTNCNICEGDIGVAMGTGKHLVSDSRQVHSNVSADSFALVGYILDAVGHRHEQLKNWFPGLSGRSCLPGSVPLSESHESALVEDAFWADTGYGPKLCGHGMP